VLEQKIQTCDYCRPWPRSGQVANEEMTNCVFAQVEARRASKSAHAVVDSGRHEAVRWHPVVHGEDADIMSAWVHRLATQNWVSS
jgi:hypothetical protein